MPKLATHRIIKLTAIVLVVCVLFGCSSNERTEEEREKVEEKFQESMTGVVLEGHFTLNGKKGLSSEKYEIRKVMRMPGDFWVFYARIQYGETDVTVPVPVKILWAGDTPVVSLTDVSIPGVGTFTARVLFYKNQYIGVWSSGTHSGQQFGRILKQKDESSEMF